MKNEGRDFPPKGHSAMSAGISVVTTGVRASDQHLLGRARGPVEHATMCGGVPIIQRYSDPSIRSADKPCFVLETSLGVGSGTSHPAYPRAA